MCTCEHVCLYILLFQCPYLYSNTLGPLQTIWISSDFSYINTQSTSSNVYYYLKSVITTTCSATFSFASDTTWAHAPSFMGQALEL